MSGVRPHRPCPDDPEAEKIPGCLVCPGGLVHALGRPGIQWGLGWTGQCSGQKRRVRSGHHHHCGCVHSLLGGHGAWVQRHGPARAQSDLRLDRRHLECVDPWSDDAALDHWTFYELTHDGACRARRPASVSRPRTINHEQIMGSLRVRIQDVSGSRISEVEAPDDVTINRILVLLVEKMNLPLNSPDGQIMSYKLH